MIRATTKAITMAIMLLVGIPLRAVDYSQLIVFGDSLSDSGQLSTGIPGIGRTYTNPLPSGVAGGRVWTQSFGNALGLKVTPSQSLALIPRGSNYAVGGYKSDDVLSSVISITPDPATTEVDPENPGFILEMEGAIRDGYLKEYSNADPNALYVLWAGMNDIRDADDPTIAANRLVTAVTRLHRAGANLIIVNNLPDISILPDTNSPNTGIPTGPGSISTDGLGTNASGNNNIGIGAFGVGFSPAIPLAVAAAAVDPLELMRRQDDSNLFNTSLSFGLGNLANANIVQTNVKVLFDEVIADPITYGYLAIDHSKYCFDGAAAAGNTCEEIPGGTVDDASKYVFYDGINPTQSAHQMIANYVQSIVVAPTQISLLAETAIRNNITVKDALLNQIESIEFHRDRGFYPIVSAVFDAQDFSRLDFNGGGSGYSQGALLGSGYAFGNGITVGAAFAPSRSDVKFKSDGGRFKLSSYTGHAFAAMDHDWLKARVFGGLGYLDYYNIKREISINKSKRIESGQTTGTRSHVGIVLEPDVLGKTDDWQFGPTVGVTYQKLNIQGYTESSNRSTAMRFGRQSRESTIVEAGIRLKYRNKKLDTSYPYQVQGSVLYNRELNDKPKEINARVSSMKSNYFRVQGIEPEKDWLEVKASGLVVLNSALTANVGLGYKHAADDSKVSFNFGMNFRF